MAQGFSKCGRFRLEYRVPSAIVRGAHAAGVFVAAARRDAGGGWSELESARSKPSSAIVPVGGPPTGARGPRALPGPAAVAACERNRIASASSTITENLV